MSTENRFAVLFDDEEETKVAKAEAAKTAKNLPKGLRHNTGHRAPKREFDRHSGTGRGREIPKNGSGPRNWGNPKDAKAALRDETADVEESPVAEEPIAAPEPVGLTLKEYEEQRKAKMSALLGKKQPRAVEPVQGEKIQKVHEDYFVAEGYKGKERKEKKLAAAAAAAAEEEEPETILTFQAVNGLADRVERPHREDRPHRDDRPRRDDRRAPREDRRAPREDRRAPRNARPARAPKVDLKNDKAFPKL